MLLDENWSIIDDKRIYNWRGNYIRDVETKKITTDSIKCLWSLYHNLNCCYIACFTTFIPIQWSKVWYVKYELHHDSVYL